MQLSAVIKEKEDSTVDITVENEGELFVGFCVGVYASLCQKSHLF